MEWGGIHNSYVWENPVVVKVGKQKWSCCYTLAGKRQQCETMLQKWSMQRCCSITGQLWRKLISWSQVFVSEIRVSQQATTTLKKSLYVLTVPPLPPCYPSGKKIKSKALSDLSKQENAPACQPHQSAVDTAGNTALGFTWITNTFYAWHWFLAFPINNTLDQKERSLKQGREKWES